MVDRIYQVLQVLGDGGIRSRRGFPTEKYFRPETPVAAVYLESVNGETVTVAAQIFATNASDCENCAEDVLQLLSITGAICMAESCKFDRQMGIFSLRVLVRWEPYEQPEPEPEPEPELPLPFTLWIGEDQIDHVTAFSSAFTGELFQSTAEDGTTSIAYNAKVWTLTVEQLLPVGEKQKEFQEPFTLTVVRTTGTETYPQCRWDSIRRAETAAGIRQVRVAKTWEARTTS